MASSLTILKWRDFAFDVHQERIRAEAIYEE